MSSIHGWIFWHPAVFFFSHSFEFDIGHVAVLLQQHPSALALTNVCAKSRNSDADAISDKTASQLPRSLRYAIRGQYFVIAMLLHMGKFLKYRNNDRPIH